MGMFSIRGSPFPFGDYHTEMGRETRIFPYGESPFPNRVCFNLGINMYAKSTVSPTTARAREALAGAREALAIDLEIRDFLVDEVRAIPTRIIAHKSGGGAAPPRSSTFGQLFPAAAVARTSRRPQSRGRPQGQGNRGFREPRRPEPVVARGPGRVDCRGCVPREHSASPRRHS